MTTAEQRTFSMIYNRVKDPKRLPWNHTDPTHFLEPISERRTDKGRALDIGCGSGVDSVFLAQQGWQVTSLDFIAQALDMTRARAAEHNVTLDAHQADVTTWPNNDKYDLIVDAGVLHNMHKLRHDAYKRRILDWLAEDGDFVLVHYLKRHALDWRPIGPRREYRESIIEFFGPDLKEHDFTKDRFTGLPIFIGPTMEMATYWFRRR